MHLAKIGHTSFSRSVMAGLACGILTSVAGVAYAYFYRQTTGFDGILWFTPLPMFIGFPIVFMIAGLIFFELADHLRKARLVFTLVFTALLNLSMIRLFNNSDKGTAGLLAGISIIAGLIMAFLLPFLATHPRYFMDEREMDDSEDF